MRWAKQPAAEPEAAVELAAKLRKMLVEREKSGAGSDSPIEDMGNAIASLQEGLRHERQCTRVFCHSSSPVLVCMKSPY